MNTKKLILALLPLCAILAWAITSSTFVKKGFYSSKEEATKACKAWQEKGGQWKFKVKEFGISKQLDKKPSLGPIKVEKVSRSSDIDKKHLDDNQKKEMQVSVLLIGSESRGKYNNREIEQKGYEWVEYDLRYCSLGNLNSKVIYGREYDLNRKYKISDNKMPKISTRKSFYY